MKTEDKLILQVKLEPRSGGQTATVTVRVMQYLTDKDGIRNLSYDRYDTIKRRDCADLVLRSYVHKLNEGLAATGHIEYHDVFSVDLDRAKRMAASLSSIERRLAKISEQYGEAHTVYDLLPRFATIVGTGMVFFHNDLKNGGGAWLTEYDGQITGLLYTALGAVNRIKRWIGEQFPEEKAA